MESFAVYEDSAVLFFDVDAESAETTDRCETVRPFQKVVYFRNSAGDGSEHHATVGYGFIAGNGYFSFQSCDTA